MQALVLFLKIIYIAAFVFEFCDFILTKQNTLKKPCHANLKCTMVGDDWPAFYWQFLCQWNKAGYNLELRVIPG